MPISDETMVKLAEGLGTLNGTLEQVVKHQDSMLLLMQAHMVDPQAHSGVIPRVTSIETTRKWITRTLIAGAVATPAAGAVAASPNGVVAKILSLIKIGSAAGGAP